MSKEQINRSYIREEEDPTHNSEADTSANSGALDQAAEVDAFLDEIDEILEENRLALSGFKQTGGQ